MQHGWDSLGFGDGKSPLLEVHATMLRALKTLLAFPALEFRETNRMSVTKKVFVSGIKVSQRTLQSLRIYLT